MISPILKNKKGEKELQVIFGLFILLIITLVILSLFFKFTEKGTKQVEGASAEYFREAKKEKAIQDCEVGCQKVKDTNTLIEFCKSAKRIDWNEDNTILGKAEFGIWEFCEEEIPCFVLIDSCQDGLYDGTKCKQVLSDPQYNNVNSYLAIANGPASGRCGTLCASNAMPSSQSGLPMPNAAGYYCDPGCTKNWRCKYGIYTG